MEVKIDSEQYNALREDLTVQFLSFRKWFRWVVIWLFLVFLLQLLQWLGIRP